MFSSSSKIVYREEIDLSQGMAGHRQAPQDRGQYARTERRIR